MRSSIITSATGVKSQHENHRCLLASIGTGACPAPRSAAGRGKAGRAPSRPRHLAPRHPDQKCRCAEVLRPGPRVDVRLQPVRGAALLPQSRGTGPRRGHALVGDRHVARGPTSIWMASPPTTSRRPALRSRQGLKIAGIEERERAYLEAAAKRCPDYRTAGRLLCRHARPDAALSRRSGCGDPLCRQPDDSQSLALVYRGRQARGRARRSGARARSGAAAMARPSRRESPVHPCRGIVAHARARHRQRAAADGGGAGGGPPGPHAGTHLAGAGRMGDGGCGQRARGGSRSPVLRGDQRHRGIVPDVLRAQPAFHRLCPLDAGPQSGRL